MSIFVATGAILVTTSLTMTLSWNPDAGVYKSKTKATGARVIASSNNDEAALANDGNESTHWTSNGCLPAFFFLENSLTNILYHACERGRCNTTGTDSTHLSAVTDGRSDTAFDVHLPSSGSNAWAAVNIALPAIQSPRYVVVKGQYSGSVNVICHNGQSDQFIGNLTAAQSYSPVTFNATLAPCQSVILRSSNPFTLYEVAAIWDQTGCVERVAVDLGSVQQVRYVRTRHWAGGSGLTSKLVASNDGVAWLDLASLDPNALHTVTTTLPSGSSARYIGVEQRQNEKDWAKVYLWEIDVYDENGIYGQAPAPNPNPASLRQMFGVNTIWGWGWGRSSPTLPLGSGAALYAPVASYARSYHNLGWDIKNPGDLPDYNKMAQGHGTNVQSWLNWDTEYAKWLEANVSVHVSVQFTAKEFPPSTWNNPHQAASQYGTAFASHFGSKGNNLVHSVEVGNEPWDYTPDFYATILDGMAEGFRSGDPNMVIMPGAFQAHDPADTGSYIGTRVTQATAGKIDVINSHHYCWRYTTDGKRVPTYPEDPTGSFKEMHGILRWRDANTPDKPLWMTEWGWDSPGGDEDCSKFSECTTEAAAAAYAARGLLMHARLGVARSTWFFYANDNNCDDHVFCRSGLTSSLSTHFLKKGPYYALQDLLQFLGDAHFLQVLLETENAHVFVFGTIVSSQGSSATRVKPTHVVAWRPIDASTAEGNKEVLTTFTFARKPAHVYQLARTADGHRELSPPKLNGDVWQLMISSMPMVVTLQAGDDVIIG